MEIKMRRADSEGVGGRDISRTPIDLKFHFLWEIMVKFDKFGIPILPQIFKTLTLYLIRSSTREFCEELLGEWQTVWALIRRRVLRRLIWIYTVCSNLSEYVE